MISVGIDVSKGKSMVCILRPYGDLVASSYEVNHVENELNLLADRIISLGTEIRVVMEATGIYHLPILCYLHQREIFVTVVNPLLMKKYASCTLRKAKTDKLDAVRIAQYGLDNWFHLEAYKADEEIYSEMRLLGRQYSHFIKIKIGNKNGLDFLISQTMPGIKSLLQSGTASQPSKDKLADFVEKYWHVDRIISQSEDVFITEYCMWAKEKGYRSNASKAESIYRLAQNAIPTLSSHIPSVKMLILEAVRILRETNKTLETILLRMQELARKLPQYETVRSMHGVGEVLSVRLIAEIGDVRRFHNGSALVAYAGIDAPPFQSGQFEGTRRKISKRGSALLRKTGFEVISCLRRSKPKDDTAVYDFLLKKEAEGKPKKVAKIAALNKFLRIYYARVKLAS